MNTNYYEVSVKYDQTQENGLVKKVTEKYLTEAFSFTEAEAKMIDYIKEYAVGEFDITAIRRQQFYDIFRSQKQEADRWYKATLAFVTIDEKSGKEKRSPMAVMVLASDFDDARNTIQEGMKGSLGDWEKANIGETRIVHFIG